MNKTLVLGASTNPDRYSYLATKRLLEHGFEIELIGNRSDVLFDKQIHTKNDIRILEDTIDTITIYLSPQHQPMYYDMIINLKPKRVIFNPGTENPILAQMLQSRNIEVLEACTLVLLSTGQY